MKEKCLYMLVSRDRYELPIAVADSIPLLARRLNMSPKVIVSAMRQARMRGAKSQYVKVEYDETEED